MHFQIYLDQGGEYRWQLKASNGKTLAESSEGYVNKSSCIDDIEVAKHSNDSIPANGVTPVKDC